MVVAIKFLRRDSGRVPLYLVPPFPSFLSFPFYSIRNLFCLLCHFSATVDSDLYELFHKLNYLVVVISLNYLLTLISGLNWELRVCFFKFGKMLKNYSAQYPLTFSSKIKCSSWLFEEALSLSPLIELGLL